MAHPVFLNVHEIFPTEKELRFFDYDVDALRRRFSSREPKETFDIVTTNATLSSSAVEFYKVAAELRKNNDIRYLGSSMLILLPLEIIIVAHRLSLDLSGWFPALFDAIEDLCFGGTRKLPRVGLLYVLYFYSTALKELCF